MGNVIAIMGESGSGKTTAMRNLDPSTTFYIDADLKGLSWKGWKAQYNAEAKNLLQTDDPRLVLAYIGQIIDKSKQIKTVVIDTMNGLMVAEDMRRAKEKNYDKWTDLASFVYNIVMEALRAEREGCGIDFVFLFHSQTEKDDDGNSWTRIKTSGRKLDKIVLESKFTTVLLCKTVGDRHIFETQSNFSTAKSPMGAFETLEIDNDIVPVLKALEDY